MKKIILILLALVMNVTLVLASAKVIIPINKELRIKAKSWFENSQYTWSLVSKEWGDILDTQNTQTYTQTFTKPWNYDLNLLIKDNSSDELKNTTIDLAIWKSFKFFEDITVDVSTIPSTDEDWEISFSTQSWTVFYYLAWSKWVKEFHIDENIDIDSDKDWINDNDIDNINDDSFKKWTSYKVNYSGNNENNTSITLVWYNDKKENLQYKIALNKKINKDYSWDLKAVVKSLPRYNKQKKEIYVPFATNEIFIYSKDSIWDFLEYRIDQDINLDSDWDWIKWNDIDNKNHPSLKQWSIFSIKRWDKESQIMQLTVISWKKWSWINRKIIWWKEIEAKDFSIFSNTDQVLVWSEIYFWISWLDDESKYPIEWDLDGDWKAEEKDKNFVRYKYEYPGHYIVKTKITDKDWKILEARLNVEAREKVENEIATTKPIAGFSYKISWPLAKFTQESMVDPNLINQEFDSLWKFWNWNISTQANPEFLYSRTWDYIIELIITDSHWKSSSVKKEIKIEEMELETWIDEITETWTSVIIKPVENKAEIVEKEIIKEEVITFENNQVLISTLKYIWIFILWIIWIIFAYLIILKIKHPDYSFWEIVEEEREKILSLIEWEPYIPPTHEIKTEVAKWIWEVLESDEEYEEVESEKQANVDEENTNEDSIDEDNFDEDSSDEKNIDEDSQIQSGDNAKTNTNDIFDFDESNPDDNNIKDNKDTQILSDDTQPDWLQSWNEQSTKSTDSDQFPKDFWDLNKEADKEKLTNDVNIDSNQDDFDLSNFSKSNNNPEPEDNKMDSKENDKIVPNQTALPPTPPTLPPNPINNDSVTTESSHISPPPPPPPLNTDLENKSNEKLDKPLENLNKWDENKKEEIKWDSAEIPDWLK